MSTLAKAHGLDRTLVEPDWPPLTLDEVRGLVARFPNIDEPLKLLSVSPRPFSAASVVATSGGRIFVKRHARLVRDSEGLVEEHRFMAHLLAHGAVVPRVFATADGETAIEMGDWVYEVHETPEGVDLYEDALSWTPFLSNGHAYSAGQALAKLHHASTGYDAPARRGRALVAGFTIYSRKDAATEMDNYIASRPALAEYLSIRSCQDETVALLEPFHKKLSPLLPELAELWTHNDLHASNLLWSNDTAEARAAAVIDFGLADRTCAVHDLAHAIERNIVEWLALVEDPTHPECVPIHLDHLYELLRGYESVRPLSETEAAALAPMTALCHVEFALSETDYFLSVLHSRDKSYMACEGYLVSHARWFRGACDVLLDALRMWESTRRRQPNGGAGR
jgi:Ser/Thr protein kinase RdoA (MazF antagonist)